MRALGENKKRSGRSCTFGGGRLSRRSPTMEEPGDLEEGRSPEYEKGEEEVSGLYRCLDSLFERLPLLPYGWNRLFK